MKAALISTHATRPVYSRKVFEAVANQCRGMVHIAGVEKNCFEPGLRGIITEFSGAFEKTIILTNEGVAHCNNNFANCLNAFMETDCEAFIYMEDDTLLSKNAVRFLLDQIEAHGDSEEFSHVTPAASEDGHAPTEHNLSVAAATGGFASLWGVSGNRLTAWRLIESTPVLDEGMRERARDDHSIVWDVAYKKVRESEGWFAVVPLVSRMQNIGVEGGLHSCGHRWETWEGQ